MNTFTSKFKWLVLFSTSTCLLCCAFPILLVSLGLGTVMASLVSTVPFIITLSHYKVWTFTLAGLLLAIAGWTLYRPHRVCPTDPALAEQCEKAHFWNKRIFWLSLFIWSLSLISAYILPLMESL